MHLEEKKALSNARFLHAQECLASARLLLEQIESAEFFLLEIRKYLDTK